MFAYNIEIRVFIKPEEINEDPYIEQKIENIFHNLIDFDFEKEKIVLKKETAEGFNNRILKIYSLNIHKESHTNKFLKNLKNNLGQECKKIISERESRLDENFFFYIRLDKKNLLKNIFKVTEEGDCFHIKIHMVAFPKKRKIALNNICKIFE